MADDARSMEDIKRDTERARAELSQTVDQLRTSVEATASDLRQRVSPSAIKAEMSEYFESRGEELVSRVKHAVRNNPVQAVAVGAALGYPLLKLLRAIPTPVLMVGAGLYLAGSKSGQAVTQQASDAAVDFAGEVERRARQFGTDASETATAAAQYTSGTLQAASEVASSRATQFRQAAASSAAELRDRADQLGKTVASNVDDLRRKAVSAGETVATQAGEVADRGAALSDAVTGSIRDAADQVRDVAASAREGAADAAARVREAAAAGRDAAVRARYRAEEFGDQAGKTFTATVSNHPLLVAGAGLVLGGLLASAIPRMRRSSDPVDDGEGRSRRAVGGPDDNIRSAQDPESALDRDSGNVRDIGPRSRKLSEATASSYETPSQNKH
ncbi:MULTISPECIES: DUF3618 domain-containing protein [Rhodopseudomonas]|uniref:Late embryogenesis abundant protein n=1 Tax=Rhodopseudomonas palustris TaxID=1076 RepID=A0A0D7E2A1_RHOPL|nr:MULTISPECIES: DUF3618 domain-containing protein [Rhodopseudomonas]KIZ34626.1 late embryogenesis abundant protein [Rhodopseudomonas palustris]MDF3812874.1 DUF3618 domain-containing protein [Rhodopseudomonas sp. BAL398]WOK17512.1 DUF3618 domain-containing protein [Rhodopseudomonas sp. BAL398]